MMTKIVDGFCLSYSHIDRPGHWPTPRCLVAPWTFGNPACQFGCLLEAQLDLYLNRMTHIGQGAAWSSTRTAVKRPAARGLPAVDRGRGARRHGRDGGDEGENGDGDGLHCARYKLNYKR